MPAPGSWIALAAILLTASGCVSPQQRVSDKEDLLAAAGFRVQPANTAERLNSLHTLPPDRFVQRARGNTVIYLYADPLVCNCLYIGDQQAYGRYRQNVFERRLANEQQLTTDTFADSSWNWGPWGGPGF